MADIRIIPSDGLVNVTGSINFKGTGGSTMLFITGSSGNVGIGTTNPGHKLDVSGSVRLGGTEAQALPIKMGWDANAVYMGGPNNNTINTGYDTNSDYNLHINYVGYQGSTTRYRNLVINDGKQALIAHFDGASRYIGIGTSSPNAPLHIVKDLGTSVSAVARLRGSNSTARTTRLQFEDYNGTIADGLIDFIIPTGGSSTGARLDVGVDSAIMSLVKGGNVGVGTTSPSYKLDVSGQIRVNNGVGNGSGQALIVGGSGDVTLTDGGSLFFGAYDYGGSTYIRGYDGGDIMYFYSNGTNMGYFRSDRAYFAVNTGIGTSSPSTRLHVSGGDAILRNAYIGEVPTYGAANSQFSHISRAGAGEYSFLSDSVGETYVNAKTGYNINFRVNNSNVAIITSAGNVGIGSTSPGKTLDVVGAIRASNAVSASAGIHIKSDGSADSSWDALTFRGTTEWGDASAYGVLGGDASEGIMLRRPHIVWSSVQSDAAIRLGRSGGSSGGDWFGVGVAASNVFFIRRSITTNSVLEVDTNGNMALGAGSDYLYVRQGGNVGVGTTNPSNKFQVVGGVTATSFTGSLLGNATSASFASTAPYSGLTGTVPTWNQNTTGTADYATYLFNRDIRAIAPNDETSGTMRFGFTSWANNNSGPYADFLHLRSYTDSSGGSDNLVMFLKSGIGMRIWQQSWNSGTDYSSYKDVAFTDSNITGNAATATTASFATTAATAATATSATSATTATTATNVAWTGVTAGRRTNYDLGFEAPSTGYAGFSFTTPGGAAENAGYFLIRGGADNDVYTQNGITLVADAGWLTLAQRTTAGKGVRIMTGTTSVERITVLEGGNVGIGTTTPSQKLHVNGSAYLQSGNLFLTQGNYITWNSGDNYIKGISGYHLQFTTYDGSSAQVEVLRLTGGTAASGGARVGIGTSVPIAKLHVSGSSGSLAFNVEGSQGQLFSVTDSLSGSLMSVNDISGLPILEVFSDDRVIGGKFGSNALSISGSNVGIGAYNPARKLDVYDAASQIVAQFSSSNATSVRIKFSDANTGAENVNIGAIGTRMALWTNNTERVSILSGGSVGIGITNPAYKLDVVGGDVRIMNTSGPTLNFSDNVDQNWDMGVDASLNDFYIKNGISGVRHLTVKTGGNVGIGTTSPLFNLQVGANAGTIATTTIRLQNTYLDTNGYYGFNIDAVDNGVDGHDLRFLGRTSPTSGFSELVRIKNGGNVGIGTTNPAYLLDVAGNIRSTGAIYANANNTLYFQGGDDAALYDINLANHLGVYGVQDSTIGSIKLGSGGGVISGKGGNIGIGTTNPSYRLHVAGTSWFEAEQSISYTNSIQSMYGGSGYSLFRMYGASNAVEMQVDTNSHNASAATLGTYSNHDVFIKTNQTNKMVVKAGGNVGIGSTNPNTLLDVAGGINTRNSRVNAGEKVPVGHYTPGETVFEIDPTWTQAQLQDYFNSSGVTWTADSTAPGGYAIQIDGAVNVAAGEYDSGFPYIPVDSSQDDWFYMECWIRNEAGSTIQHYMGGVDFDHAFGSLGGNPGSYTYNVMLNYNPGTSWTKVFGYWNGFGNSSGGSGTGNTNNWKAGTKYFTPQALFNYGFSGGTRRCYISGWKCVRVRATGNRYYTNNVLVSGNVGIGTTNPGFKLDVSGSIRTLTGYIQGANSSADITIDGNTGTLLRYGTQKLLLNSSNAILYTADAIRLFITNDGNIGIGTTAPTQLLHIQGANAGNNGISLQNTNASGNSQVRFLNTSGTERAAITYVNSADAVYHYTAGGGNLFNLVGGNVGIGTATPAVLLHLYGSGNTFTRYTNTSNSGHYVDIGANSAGESFIYGYGAYPVLFGTNGSEKMRILSNGNVGIGTTAPTHLLHVSGGGIRIQGTGPVNSLRLDDTGGTSRNAMYVSSSNYLVIDNINYTGLQLVHTGSAPTPNDGNGITSYYGTDERFYLAEPNNWLAIRINTTNYVIPMYQV